MAAHITTGTILVANENSEKPLEFWQITRKSRHDVYLRQLPLKLWETAEKAGEKDYFTPDLFSDEPASALGYLLTESNCVSKRQGGLGYLHPWSGAPLAGNTPEHP